jgi:HAD superfamily hydrolase (TIGR01509 family)
MTAERPSTTSILAGKPIAAILFDVDGTLYLQSRLRRRVLLRLLSYSLANPRAGVRAIRVVQEYRRALENLRERPVSCDIGLEQLEMTAQRAGLTSAETDRIMRQWFISEPLKILPACACEGLARFLAAASARSIRMAIVSDYEPAGKLEALGVARHFEAIVTPRNTGRLKPHPAGLQRALDLLQVDPEQALYIGDRLDVDLPAAQHAGVRCAILGTRPSRGNASFLPFRSYAQLPALLDPYLQ